MMHFCLQNIVAHWRFFFFLCVTTIRWPWKQSDGLRGLGGRSLTETLQSGRTLFYKPTTALFSTTRVAHNLVWFINYKLTQQFFVFIFLNLHVWNRKLSRSFLDDVFATVSLQPNVKNIHRFEFCEPCFSHSCIRVPFWRAAIASF